MMATTELLSEREHAIENLRELLKPGDTVYTVLRYVLASRMYRVIDLYVIREDKPHWIAWSVARALGEKMHKLHQGIGVSGVGMDMGFALVYNLGNVLFPKGFGVKCRDCDFVPDSVEQGRLAGKAFFCPGRLYGPHTFIGRNGDPSGWDHHGGYALRQVWL